MSGLCSKHRGHDSNCSMCTAMTKPRTVEEVVRELLDVVHPVQLDGERLGIAEDVRCTERIARAAVRAGIELAAEVAEEKARDFECRQAGFEAEDAADYTTYEWLRGHSRASREVAASIRALLKEPSE